MENKTKEKTTRQVILVHCSSCGENPQLIEFTGLEDGHIEIDLEGDKRDIDGEINEL